MIMFLFLTIPQTSKKKKNSLSRLEKFKGSFPLKELTGFYVKMHFHIYDEINENIFKDQKGRVIIILNDS